VTVTNAGTAPLLIKSISGTGIGQYVSNGDCTSTIAPGAFCSLIFYFFPQSVGPKVERITVRSNAQNDSSDIGVTLSGIAVPQPKPVMRLSATTLGFGNVIYGGNSASQGVTLLNVGTGPLVILGIDMSGQRDFTQTNNCGNIVNAQGQCNITINFGPHALGARTGLVTVRSNADGSPHQVQLGGTGCRVFSPTAARLTLTSC
jgi:hypothetical protein